MNGEHLCPYRGIAFGDFPPAGQLASCASTTPAASIAAKAAAAVPVYFVNRRTSSRRFSPHLHTDESDWKFDRCPLIRTPGSRYEYQFCQCTLACLEHTLRIDSTSYTRPTSRQLTSCSAAHKRVSSGNNGSGARSFRGGRAASTQILPRRSLSDHSTDEINPALERVAIDDNLDHVAGVAQRSAGERFRRYVPDAAPVDTPLNRASVTTATCLPKERCRNAAVS